MPKDEPIYPSTIDEEQIDAMAADFSTRSEEHEREKSFPYENIDALKKSGAYKMMVPIEMGGAGGDMAQALRVMRRIGEGDSSTAIVMVQHVAVAASFAVEAQRGHKGLERFLREEVANDKLSNLFAGVPEFDERAQVTAERVEGGFKINGRKGFGTGCVVADYGVTPTVWVKSPEERMSVRVIYPMDAPGVTIKDNWDTLGMRASLSHDFELKDVFVPDDLVVLTAPENPPGSPPDALTLKLFVPGFSLFAAMYLGIADAAFKCAKELLAERTPVGSTTPNIMNPGLQSYLGEIDQKIREASAMLHWTGHVHRDPMEWDLPALPDIVAMKDSVTHKAAEATQMCMAAVGAASYYSRLPLERLFRDALAGPMHPMQHPAAMSMLGKMAAQSVLPDEGS